MPEGRELLAGHIVAVDPGQVRDPTGICVLRVYRTEVLAGEQEEHESILAVLRARRIAKATDGMGVPYGGRVRAGDVLRVESRYEIGHLNRLLGESYVHMVEYVADLLREPLLREHPCTLVVDGTGVGRGVVDLLRVLVPKEKMVAYSIHGGQTVTFPGGYIGVPKIDLVGLLATLLDSGRLTIVKELQYAEALVHELQNFRLRWTAAGNATASAWRESDHDDLLLASALGCFQADREKHAHDRVPSRWTLLTG